MNQVLTVIGDPASRVLSLELAETARQILRDRGAETAEVDWLAPGIACDIAFTGLAPDAAEAALRQGLAKMPLDLAVQPRAGRRKALLLADMESTIIPQEMIDELADHLGLGPKVAEITARAMAGELDFEGALATRVALFAGQSAAALDEVAARITLTPGARTLVRTMRAGGAHTALVSGGFTAFTQRVQAACGFDEARANRLLLAEGRITGQVAEPVLGPGAKLEALEEIVAARGLTPAEVLAVGDGANDADMLAGAGLGVGYRPKAPARAAADLAIDHGDLTALLYLQGYRSEDFVE